MIAIASLVCAGNTHAETSKTNIPPDRVSFYEAPLVCPAAPEIGCGSRSKPILLQLEQEQSVAEAWLNRPGTVIAVVWKPETKRKERTAAFEAVSKKEELKANELKGGARKKALKDFLFRSSLPIGEDEVNEGEDKAEAFRSAPPT